MEKCIKQVKYQFSQPELAEMAGQMAQVFQEVKDLEGDLKTSQGQIKGKINESVARANSLAARYNSGWELRPMECEIQRNHGTGRVIIVRIDTGEIVESRDMTEAEIQMKLADVE